MYSSTPPWDIGRPQPAFLDLRSQISGRVLDVGCGTGEHALMAASWGLPATGVDTAPTAIERARRKANDRQLSARFLVHDALTLGELNDQFETAIDSGLFHVFDDADRLAYVTSLHSALAPGGRLHLLCFSDAQPGDTGPRRVSEAEIRASFANGWHIDEITAVTMEITIPGERIQAWRASITRV